VKVMSSDTCNLPTTRHWCQYGGWSFF